MIPLFDTQHADCQKHGNTVFAKLTSDRRAERICVKCALEVLQKRAASAEPATNGLTDTCRDVIPMETTR